MFRLPVRGMLIADPRLLEFGLVSLHMRDAKVAEHDDGIAGMMDPVREIQVLIDEIQILVKQRFFEYVRRGQERIS